MRNILVAVAALTALICAPAFAQDAPRPAEAPASSETFSLDDALVELDKAINTARSAIEAARGGGAVIVEGAALLETIHTEVSRIAEQEAKCLDDTDDECTKIERERCSLLNASYRKIEERFAAFDNKVKQSAFPDEVKGPIAEMSAQIKDGIKSLKEQLERGSCLDA